MDEPKMRGLSQGHFRFGQNFNDQKVFSAFQGLLPPRPYLSSGPGLTGPLGLFGHAPQAKSFSIESLLGLSDSHDPGQLINFNQFQQESKPTKLLRYTPYKRERKMSHHTQQPQASADSKETVASRNGKAKRVRTIFTPEQLEKLESEFERQQYMVGTERSYLAESLDLTEAQVKVWFQNRRIKWRKVHLEMQQERLRALRAEEGPEFESGSDSSSLSQMESSMTMDIRGSDGQRVNEQSHHRTGHRENPTGLQRPTEVRWESGGHLNTYLLNTMVSPGGQWRSGRRLVTSEESETESD